jgi:curved DNA-binding protein CbpA
MKPLEFHRLVLGVDAGATAEQLRQAYIDLVKRWHPDRFAHDRALQEAAEAKLKEINEAYKELRANLGLSADTATVHTQSAAATARKDEHEQPAASKPAPPPRSARARPSPEIKKRDRSLRSFSIRLLTIGLALMALFLAIAAIIHHVDFDRLSGSTGASANQPGDTLMAPANKDVSPQERAEFIEKMKNSYEATLKTLVDDEEEKGRLQVEYTRRHELFGRNMMSREELVETERDLAKATAKVAEDKQRLAKTELAIAEATVAQDKGKQAGKEN